MFRRTGQWLLMVAGLMAGTAGAQQRILEIDGEVLRDPTQPPNAVLGMVSVSDFETLVRFNPNNYRVSFIRSGGINPVAVVNNHTVTIGDQIDGVITVSDIKAGAVVLKADGLDHEIRLYDQPVRQEIQATGNNAPGR